MTDVPTLGLLGTGAMGAGIAQVAATHGWRVRMMDARPTTVTEAIERIGGRLSRMVEKGRLTPEGADTARDRLLPTTRAADFGECDLILEAIVEDLEAKVEAMGPLVAAASGQAMIATNTSSLSVTTLGDRLGCGSRICGLHFFNPAPVMRLVEVIRGRDTSDAFVQQAKEIATGWDKQVAEASDTPGFIVNRVARPYYLEAFRCLEDGVAGPEVIDDAMRSHGGFRMGPFELTDFIGHDVNTATTRTVWSQWNEPARLRPSAAQEQLVAEGQLGRKTGAGVYDYSGETAVPLLRRWQDASVATGDDESIRAFAEAAGVTQLDGPVPLIVTRILAALINEAMWAHHDGVASEADIDTAMRYGVNYPQGPFAWREQIGPDRVTRALETLEQMTGTGRFLSPP